MRQWNLKAGDPLALILAADVRSGPTDYGDDQIWELALGGGTPPALALQTTFGLRARSVRLYPIYIEGEILRSDPSEFTNPPVIQQIFPNYLSLAYSPFPDIEILCEYWVPQSHAIAARMQITNRGTIGRKIQIDCVDQLAPNEGQRMAAVEIQAVTVLVGQTDNLAPVFFLTGGPKPGSGAYPSLRLALELSPDETHQYLWAHTALQDTEASFNLARAIASQKWEAERSRMEMFNSSGIEILCGDPDWEAAFMLTQKTAISLLIGPTPNLPNPSLVQTRTPDQGFSLRGDGSDYTHLWNGQSPLETLYLVDQILPLAPQIAQGLLRNYLAVQAEDGFIDWKPGLGGQRSRLLATPVLATLAWRIYEMTEDLGFLAEVFPSLLKFIQTWFSPLHDRDGDGVPEWDHAMQLGAEDHPYYSHWHTWALGAEISSAESPALCAFLYRECQMLMRMAMLLEIADPLETLPLVASRLRNAVEESWNATENSYFDWDRDTHRTTPSEQLGQQTGSGILALGRSFDPAIRLFIQIQSERIPRPRPQITIYGKDRSGIDCVDAIPAERLKWLPERARLTGERLYTYLDRIEIEGLEPEDHLSLHALGYDHLDITVLTPLWAGIPYDERARLLVENTILNPQRFWQAYGMPACAKAPENPEAVQCCGVSLPWNSLIGEGLVSYGYRSEAAALVTRLMAGVVQNLKRENAFRRTYLASNGQGMGERNALAGLAPLGLFMEVLGVRLISPRRVALAGYNPFPWPVTVKYRGLTILRQKDKTMVIFSDGQTVIVNEPDSQIVSLEMEES